MAKVVSKFSLSVPSIVADLNLFEEEIGWKGEKGGNVRPVKATVLWAVVMHLPPRLRHSLQPTLGCYCSGACSGQVQLSRLLTWMGNEVRWPQG